MIMIINSLSTTLSSSSSSSGSLRSNIDSFKVMDVVERCETLEREGRSICHMEVGQPSTGAPSKVLDAAVKAIHSDRLGYTNAKGILLLRQAIANSYKTKYGIDISSDRIIVTTGSSAAFMFAFLGCFDIDDNIGICSRYRHYPLSSSIIIIHYYYLLLVVATLATEI
jgi:aspartate/methionine/tyrosine aminotransferase